MTDSPPQVDSLIPFGTKFAGHFIKAAGQTALALPFETGIAAGLTVANEDVIHLVVSE